MDGRKKDGPATREAILEAARTAFTRAGFQGAGVREIAALVGVHPSLVNRYFGTKQELFDEAVPSTFDISPLLPTERADFAPAVARHVLSKEKGAFDPTLAMVRSVGDPDAVRMLKAGLQERFVEPLAGWLSGPDARERAGLILAMLAGVAIVRDVLGVEALASDGDTVADRLGEVLAALVDA